MVVWVEGHNQSYFELYPVSVKVLALFKTSQNESLLTRPNAQTESYSPRTTTWFFKHATGFTPPFPFYTLFSPPPSPLHLLTMPSTHTVTDDFNGGLHTHEDRRESDEGPVHSTTVVKDMDGKGAHMHEEVRECTDSKRNVGERVVVIDRDIDNHHHHMDIKTTHKPSKDGSGIAYTTVTNEVVDGVCIHEERTKIRHIIGGESDEETRVLVKDKDIPGGHIHTEVSDGDGHGAHTHTAKMVIDRDTKHGHFHKEIIDKDGKSGHIHEEIIDKDTKDAHVQEMVVQHGAATVVKTVVGKDTDHGTHITETTVEREDETRHTRTVETVEADASGENVIKTTVVDKSFGDTIEGNQVRAELHTEERCEKKTTHY